MRDKEKAYLSLSPRLFSVLMKIIVQSFFFPSQPRNNNGEMRSGSRFPSAAGQAGARRGAGGEEIKVAGSQPRGDRVSPCYSLRA